MLTAYIEDRKTQSRPFFDELLDQDGEIWGHWQQLLNAYDEMGLPSMLRKHREVQRQLRENGVTYNVYGDPDGLNRPWDLDAVPMVFARDDWKAIEAGLLQRTHLFNQLLLDLYGSRTLLRSGNLPLEVIYNHPGFLRHADKIRLKGGQQLIHYSADLARGPNGKMWVLNDRTDAPSGAGYVLENRAAMTRVFPDLIRENRVRKLVNYYQTMRNTLQYLAPGMPDDPRIVLLSPGPSNETYFEHAYLSAFLGFTLAFGQDLTVRDGYVWLKTIRGLKKVDVILRRVDDVYCDPLEFRGDSQLGVVGLMESVRQGKVAVANPMGCRILENPGIMAFLPSLCREMLGEDLLLPSVATWWCGQPKELNYVLDHLPELIIKHIYRDHQQHSIYGGNLTKAALEQLRKKIQQHPYLYVGQEVVSFSTTPSLVKESLQARNALFRSYVVADVPGDSYVVMPGGLARTSPDLGLARISTQAGGISKDAWVLGHQPETHESGMQSGITFLRPVENVLPSRTAESLYWLGRYSERVISTVRLMRITLRKYNETDIDLRRDQDDALRTLFRSLTFLTGAFPGFVDHKHPERAEEHLQHPEPELISMAVDRKRTGSLAHSIDWMMRNSYTVRDRLSLDTWRILDEIKEVQDRLESSEDLMDIYDTLDYLIIRLMAFKGLILDNMTREPSWQLLNLGRLLESAVGASSLMRSILVPAAGEVSQTSALLESLLVVQDSLITYRYRYRSNLQVSGVLTLLLQSEDNPRSMMHFLVEMESMIAALSPRVSRTPLTRLEKVFLEAKTRLQLADVRDLAVVDDEGGLRVHLEEAMAHIHHLMMEASDLLTEIYFNHTGDRYSLVRAPEIPEI